MNRGFEIEKKSFFDINIKFRLKNINSCGQVTSHSRSHWLSIVQLLYTYNYISKSKVDE